MPMCCVCVYICYTPKIWPNYFSIFFSEFDFVVARMWARARIFIGQESSNKYTFIIHLYIYSVRRIYSQQNDDKKHTHEKENKSQHLRSINWMLCDDKKHEESERKKRGSETTKMVELNNI